MIKNYEKNRIYFFIKIYSLLSSIFLQCNFEEQLEKIREILLENKTIKNMFWQKAKELIIPIFKNKNLLKTKNSVEVDFARLFLGVKKTLVPPYESVWRSKDRLVMQKETAAVRNFYLEAGLKVKNQGEVPDDHIGIELEFMAFLWAKILESLQNNWEKNHRKFLRLKEDFYQKHLQVWTPQFCRELIKHSSTNFYSGIACLLKVSLNV
jgi:TorA maturation chaperone TorD